MVMRRRIPFLLIILLLPLTAVYAQEDSQPHHAGLIVDYGDGRVESYCVAFEGEQISGTELLQQSGIPVLFSSSGGNGTAVCAMNEIGCAADDCFCQCAGGSECIYWSYWQLREGQWRYAAVGANRSQVHDGDVEGWVWGPGTVAKATPPLSTSIAQICTDYSPAAVANPVSGSTVVTSSTGPQLSYIGFVALLAVLGGILLVVRRRLNG